MTALVWMLAVAALTVAAVIRGTGASLVRTNRADALRAAADGDSGARVVAGLLDGSHRLQASIALVHTALVILTSLAAAWALASTTRTGWVLAGAMALAGVVILLAGEVVPRAAGRLRPGRLAYRFAPLLHWVVSVGGAASDLVEDEEDEEEVEAEEVDQGREERQLISSVIDFADTLVREVMMPRPDMVTVPAVSSSEEALDVVIEQGYSRIPVVGEGIDDILGIVYAKDLLRLMDQGAGPTPTKDLMRPAYYVPETKRVNDLLRDMQTRKVHMAIVVDEFGGTSGLVTIEDLLEELVGEIADEFDAEEPMVVPTEEGDLVVDARLGVDELSELVGAELPDEDWDTVAGLVLALAGRVPREGESFEVGPVVITCIRVQGRRVAKVRVHRITNTVAGGEA